MTYENYINRESNSLICDFKMSADQAITSTSSYSETVLITSVSGDAGVTISNNIINLPKGYEFLVRFFVGVSRNSTNAELYTKAMFSDGSSIDSATVSEIGGGTSNNQSSLEDVTFVIDTSRESKSIVFKTHKTLGYTVTMLKDHCYGIILGFEK